MKPVLRRIFISAQIAVLVALAPTASLAADDEASVGAKIFDAMILRPIGAARLLVGAGALAVTSVLYTFRLPFDSDTGPFEEAAEILVVEPGNYVFRRPLGEDLSGS